MKQRAQLTEEQELRRPDFTTERAWGLGGPFLRSPPGRHRTHQRCQLLTSLQRLRDKEKYGLHSKRTESSGPWWHATNYEAVGFQVSTIMMRSAMPEEQHMQSEEQRPQRA